MTLEALGHEKRAVLLNDHACIPYSLMRPPKGDPWELGKNLREATQKSAPVGVEILMLVGSNHVEPANPTALAPLLDSIIFIVVEMCKNL